MLAIQPRHFDALHLLGLIAYQTGNYSQAVELIGAAIGLNPGVAAAYSNRGLALQELKRLDEALDNYDHALRLKPDYAEAYRNRGDALQALGRPAEALDSYDRALALSPGHAEVYSNRGGALQALGRLDEALDSYDRALELEPDLAEAHRSRGNTLRKLDRLDEALDSYDRALKLRPDFAEVYGMRGNVLQALTRFDEALDSYDRALELKPDHAEAYNNRGGALQALGRLEEALDSYDRALEFKPDYAQAHSNRGNALQGQKRLYDALESYGRALKFAPDLAEAHLNLSLCRLLMGDFERGWQGYEWRWRSAPVEKRFGKAPVFAQPLWLGGQSLQGKTILLHGEQGLGDTLQFCRYATMVRDLGARVIMEVPGPLSALLNNLAGVAQLVETGRTLPEFDCHCPLLSLPLAFRTALSDLPSFDRYVASDPHKVAAWAAKLGERTRPRVGLVWSGSPVHDNDRNRSIALSDMVERLPRQYQYVSLQKETRNADREALGARADILRFEGQLDDFADTAALCELMDVVVSVDTSVAHLAGALGKPVWILLPFMPDWRWLLDREDSPWYPSARLFRQDSIGDWSGALEKVRAALLRRLRTKA